MNTHAFKDDPRIPGVCAADDCGLPRSNRRHKSIDTGAPAGGKVTPRVNTHYATDQPPPSAHGSATSELAAKLVMPQAGTLRHKVLLAIADSGAHGLTDDEIGARTELGGNTVRPGRGELAIGGWITRLENHGGRITRPTLSGNQADVWVLSPAGRALLGRQTTTPAR